MIDRFKLSINNRIKARYRDDEFNILKKNFAQFCKLLSRNFYDNLEEIDFLTKDGELLESKIDNIGISEFLNKAKMFYNAGFDFEITALIEESLEIIANNEKYPLLFYIAKLYTYKTKQIKTDFANNKKLSELILLVYEKILQIYDQILEIKPYDNEVKRLKIDIFFNLK